jgi:hypothetical protein
MRLNLEMDIPDDLYEINGIYDPQKLYMHVRAVAAQIGCGAEFGRVFYQNVDVSDGMEDNDDGAEYSWFLKEPEPRTEESAGRARVPKVLLSDS